MTKNDFLSTMVGAIYMGKPITLDAALGMSVPPAPPFQTPLGDKAELEISLQAKPGTAPTSDTQG